MAYADSLVSYGRFFKHLQNDVEEFAVANPDLVCAVEFWISSYSALNRYSLSDQLAYFVCSSNGNNWDCFTPVDPERELHKKIARRKPLKYTENGNDYVWIPTLIIGSKIPAGGLRLRLRNPDLDLEFVTYKAQSLRDTVQMRIFRHLEQIQTSVKQMTSEVFRQKRGLWRKTIQRVCQALVDGMPGTNIAVFFGRIQGNPHQLVLVDGAPAGRVHTASPSGEPMRVSTDAGIPSFVMKTGQPIRSRAGNIHDFITYARNSHRWWSWEPLPDSLFDMQRMGILAVPVVDVSIPSRTVIGVIVLGRDTSKIAPGLFWACDELLVTAVAERLADHVLQLQEEDDLKRALELTTGVLTLREQEKQAIQVAVRNSDARSQLFLEHARELWGEIQDSKVAQALDSFVRSLGIDLKPKPPSRGYFRNEQ